MLFNLTLKLRVSIFYAAFVPKTTCQIIIGDSISLKRPSNVVNNFENCTYEVEVDGNLVAIQFDRVDKRVCSR